MLDAKSVEPGVAYSSAFEASQARILLVDDNDINRKVFVSLLKKTKVLIDEADGGHKALTMSLAKKYDIIFMDHMMPDMNGDEVLKRIREDRNNINRDTPIIALTANALTGSREAFMNLGFDEFISKPFNPASLELLIKSFLPEALMEESISESASDNRVPEMPADDASYDIGESKIPPVEGIDVDYALTKLPTEDLLLETMKDFVHGAANASAELNRLYEGLKLQSDNTDYESYRVKVHGMKSSAAYIGGVSVSGLARFLEYAARDQELGKITAVHAAFIDEWNALADRLSAVVKPQTYNRVITGATPFDPEFFAAKIKILNESLQDMDIDKADAILAQLCEYETSVEIGSLLEELSSAVTNIDINAGSKVTEKILSLLGG